LTAAVTRRPGIAPAETEENVARARDAHLRLAWFYDLDSCQGPTGVTRHALAQLERLIQRPGIALQAITGRITRPAGTSYWELLSGQGRRRLPLRTRNILRWWRIAPWPHIESWAGPLDWVYCPAEFFVPARKARRAVTSHDVWQALQYEPPRKRHFLSRVFGGADLILSVSHFNTERLLEAFPTCRDRVAYVPNGADDLFFEPSTDEERGQVYADLGLSERVPYLLSVANFQPRKNLLRLIRAAARLPEVAKGDLALVLIGTGAEDEARVLREAAAATGPRTLIRMPGYRQGRALRAIYAASNALVFPSLCESFGIPVVEAMAQGAPVALADSTALPEIGGRAGWYFDPSVEEAITATLRSLLDDHAERARRAELGQSIAKRYRWDAANDLLVEALMKDRADILR
jgi:alpha-1,3-rhamnosyl/mannosyltransferase